MKSIVIGAMVLLFSSAAHANCVGNAGPCVVGGGGSATQSNATAGAVAGASARVSLNNTARAAGGAGGQGGQGGSAQSSGGNVNVDNSGTGGVRYERQAASAFAAPITSFNPCSSSGVSAGLQLPLLGLSAATQGYDNSCRLHQLGLDVAAREYLCKVNLDIRSAIYFSALMRANMPCLADLEKLNKQFSAAGQPPAALVNVIR